MVATKKRRTPNLRQRGSSWVVSFRQDGKQVWRSFKTKDEAQTYLANVNLKRANHERVAVPARKVVFREIADEWIRISEHERACSASTMRDYRSVVAQLKDAFGTLRLEQVTAGRIEAWRNEQMEKRHVSNRCANKWVSVLHGIFELARQPRYGYGSNPTDEIPKLTEPPPAALDFYSPEEVWALVRAAKDEQDGALFLTAAFSGLRRGELIALRWRDVDFAGHSLRVSGSYSAGALGLPKWGKVRSVPMVDDLAAVLAKLGQRDESTGDDDLVFPGNWGGYLDGSALRRRYVAAQKKAGLRPLRFHDLRHVFGSLAIRKADIVQLQSWMGHANVTTTRRYLHFRPQATDAALLGEAFKIEKPDEVASILQAPGVQLDAAGFRSDAGEPEKIPVNTTVQRNEAAGDDKV